MSRKRIIIETVPKGYEITYEDGRKMFSEHLLFLADHAPDFRFISGGNSERVAQLIFAAYNTAVKLASQGDANHAFFCQMLEAVSRDIARCADYYKEKDSPETVKEAIEAEEEITH